MFSFFDGVGRISGDEEAVGACPAADRTHPTSGTLRFAKKYTSRSDLLSRISSGSCSAIFTSPRWPRITGCFRVEISSQYDFVTRTAKPSGVVTSKRISAEPRIACHGCGASLRRQCSRRYKFTQASNSRFSLPRSPASARKPDPASSM